MSFGTFLGVYAVDEVGLLAEWNQKNPLNAVHVGDHIVSINGVSGDMWAMARMIMKAQQLDIVMSRPAKLSLEEAAESSSLNTAEEANVESPEWTGSLVKRDDARIGIEVDMSFGTFLGVYLVDEVGLLAEWNQQNP